MIMKIMPAVLAGLFLNSCTQEDVFQNDKPNQNVNQTTLELRELTDEYLNTDRPEGWNWGSIARAVSADLIMAGTLGGTALGASAASGGILAVPAAVAVTAASTAASYGASSIAPPPSGNIVLLNAQLEAIITNPSNGNEQIGVWHNLALVEVFANCNTCTPEQALERARINLMNELSLTESEMPINLQTNIDWLNKYDYNQIDIHINIFDAGDLTLNVYNAVDSYMTALEAESNYEEFCAYSISFEDIVSTSTTYTDQEKAQLLSMASVARYSAAFWLNSFYY